VLAAEVKEVPAALHARRNALPPRLVRQPSERDPVLPELDQRLIEVRLVLRLPQREANNGLRRHPAEIEGVRVAHHERLEWLRIDRVLDTAPGDEVPRLSRLEVDPHRDDVLHVCSLSHGHPDTTYRRPTDVLGQCSDMTVRRYHPSGTPSARVHQPSYWASVSEQAPSSQYPEWMLSFNRGVTSRILVYAVSALFVLSGVMRLADGRIARGVANLVVAAVIVSTRKWTRTRALGEKKDAGRRTQWIRRHPVVAALVLGAYWEPS